jgi:hypothetical protein
MTKESMIKVLRYKAEHIKTRIKPEFFLEVADALEQQSEDAISRSSLLGKLDDCYKEKVKIAPDNMAEGFAQVEKLIKQELPVTPKQRTGHWIYDYLSADGHKVYHCSECGCYLKPKHSEPLNSFKWCSSCGARMIEPQAESEE